MDIVFLCNSPWMVFVLVVILPYTVILLYPNRVHTAALQILFCDRETQIWWSLIHLSHYLRYIELRPSKPHTGKYAPKGHYVAILRPKFKCCVVGMQRKSILSLHPQKLITSQAFAVKQHGCSCLILFLICLSMSFIFSIHHSISTVFCCSFTSWNTQDSYCCSYSIIISYNEPKVIEKLLKLCKIRLPLYVKGNFVFQGFSCTSDSTETRRINWKAGSSTFWLHLWRKHR